MKKQLPEMEQRMRIAEKKFKAQSKKRKAVNEFVGLMCQEGAQGSTKENQNAVFRGVFHNPDLVILEW